MDIQNFTFCHICVVSCRICVVVFVLCHVVLVWYLCCVTLPIRICVAIPALGSFSSDIRHKSHNSNTKLLHIRHKSDTHLSNRTLSNPTQIRFKLYKKSAHSPHVPHKSDKSDTNLVRIRRTTDKSDTRPTQLRLKSKDARMHGRKIRGTNIAGRWIGSFTIILARI